MGPHVEDPRGSSYGRGGSSSARSIALRTSRVSPVALAVVPVEVPSFASEPTKASEPTVEQYEAGEIDNAWDVIDEVSDQAERLSKKSPVWKPFKQMFDELADLCQGDQ